MAAKAIGKRPSEISRIIKGYAPVNADFAIRFALAFGTSYEVRLNMQNKRNVWNANQDHWEQYQALEKEFEGKKMA